MSIKNLIIVNLVGLVISIAAKTLIKNQRLSSSISNISLYAGTFYFLFTMINRPKYEEESVKTPESELIAKKIFSNSNSEEDFISIVNKTKNVKLEANLNKNGIKVNSIELPEFKNRDDSPLLTIGTDSYLQFSLYNGENEVEFKDFSKNESGAGSANSEINSSYSISDDGEYRNNIEFEIKNKSKDDIKLRVRGIIKPKASNKTITVYNQGNVKSLSQGNQQNTCDWISFTAEYWTSCLLGSFKSVNLFSDKDRQIIFFESDEISIPKGESRATSFSIISIPITTENLKFYEDQGIKKLTRSVNYTLFGMLKYYFACFFELAFYIIKNPLLTLVFIILLIKILTCYFDYIAYILGKKLNRLIELSKFSNDGKLIQEEISKNSKSFYFIFFYKYLFKIGLFIVFYQVISESIIFYKAPFLWIKDLSLADPRSIGNLFGLLEKPIPFIPRINILSISTIFLFSDRKMLSQGNSEFTIILLLITSTLISNFPSIICFYSIINNGFEKLQNKLFEEIE